MYILCVHMYMYMYTMYILPVCIHMYMYNQKIWLCTLYMYFHYPIRLYRIHVSVSRHLLSALTCLYEQIVSSRAVYLFQSVNESVILQSTLS